MCLIKHRPMPMCGEVEVQLHTSLPSVPEGGELSVLCPVRLNPGEGPICLGIRAGIRPRAGHVDPEGGRGVQL